MSLNVTVENVVKVAKC